MTFRVYVDDAIVYSGRALRAGDPAVAVHARLSGARTMTLEVEARGILEQDGRPVSALWGEATFAAR